MPYYIKYICGDFLQVFPWKYKVLLSLNVTLQGSVAIAGAAVQWLKDNIGIIKKSADIGKTQHAELTLR